MTTKPEPLRILELRIKNVQRVRAVHIKPSGSLVKIQGKNRSGKTSILSAIRMALGGKAEFTDQPLRHGEREGEILLTLGGADGKPAYTIRRAWTDDGREALQFTDAEGVPVKGPETFLRSLIGLGYAFDPLAFVRADAKAQAETLRKLAGLDFTDLERAREKAYAQRTLVNRDLATATAALRGLPMPKADVPGELLIVADLIAERDRRQTVTRENDEQRFQAERLRSAIAGYDEEIHRIEHKLAEMKVLRSTAALNLNRREADNAALADPNVAEVDQQIREAETINAAVRGRDAYAKADGHVKQYAEAAAALTKQLDDIDAQRNTRVAAAAMPVEGLGFDAAGLVTFNGLPFSQASDAEQLHISTSIAVAGNARAKIALVNHGNELDSDGLAVLAGIVEKAGATCWIARVTDGDGDGWVIEDGMVKSEPADLQEA